MTVPTPSDKYTDYSSFTANGSPATITDQHGTTIADHDGVDDYYSSSLTPFAGGGDVASSFAFWIKYNQSHSTDKCLLAQRGSFN